MLRGHSTGFVHLRSDWTTWYRRVLNSSSTGRSVVQSTFRMYVHKSIKFIVQVILVGGPFTVTAHTKYDTPGKTPKRAHPGDNILTLENTITGCALVVCGT